MPTSEPGPRPLGLPDDLTWPVRLARNGVGGGPTPAQASGPKWRRSSHGLYVPADVQVTTEQRIVEAAAALPTYGGVSGWAALRWLGGVWFEGLRRGGRERRPVTLAVADRSIRSQLRHGIATSEERMDPTELTAYRGLRVTTPLRSLFFEMRYAASDTEAVQAADMAAYSDLVSASELRAFIRVNAGWTGMERSRLAASEMEENAWSPTEVAMRGVWRKEAGLPRPLCNHPVFDRAGNHVGTPDLIDPGSGVVGEYSGAVHLSGAQRSRDVVREARFRAVGLETVEMLAGDLVDPFSFLARLRQAYARAERQAAFDRRWTLALPSWWIPTFTVEQRRRLTESQRQRLLRYRHRAS
ncbi:MAG TPA: hypothetical protein VHW64_08225 [Nocardioides sp.]|jgi:hypothetical protein|uniref:hypothetical protein n=1 Tax=Nocardioides sp. TaxID=35761 RepID=UPI002E31DE5F|nr:hypothetical protein [Nocardioides sp.]HEX3930675.1 hypothetical protein [Nocardioides sp.]